MYSAVVDRVFLNVIWVKLVDNVIQVACTLTDFFPLISLSIIERGVEILNYNYGFIYFSLYVTLFLVLYLANPSFQGILKFWILFSELTETIWELARFPVLKPGNSCQVVNMGSSHLFPFLWRSLSCAFCYQSLKTIVSYTLDTV